MSDVYRMGQQIATQGGIAAAIEKAHADLARLTLTLNAGGVSPQQLTEIAFSSVSRALGQRANPVFSREQHVDGNSPPQADDDHSMLTSKRTTAIENNLASRSARIDTGQPKGASSKSTSLPAERRAEPVKATKVFVAQQPIQGVGLTPASPLSPSTPLDPAREPDAGAKKPQTSPGQAQTRLETVSTRDSFGQADRPSITLPDQSANPGFSPRPIQLSSQTKSTNPALPATITPGAPVKSSVPSPWLNELSSAYERYWQIGNSLVPSPIATNITQPGSLPTQPEAWDGAADQVDASPSSEHPVGGGRPVDQAFSPRSAPSGKLASQTTQRSVDGWSGAGSLDTPDGSAEQRRHSPGGQDSSQSSGRASLTQPQNGQAISGDVYLDGAAVGRWLSRMMSKEAERASAGPTGYDLRRGRLLPGPGVGM